MGHSNDIKKQLDGYQIRNKDDTVISESVRKTNPNGGNTYERVELTSEDTYVGSDRC
jgi:hypothetical protein